jgi:hypothetical protein
MSSMAPNWKCWITWIWFHSDKHEDDAHLHVSPFDWPGNSCLHLIVTETLFVLFCLCFELTPSRALHSLASPLRRRQYFLNISEPWNETKKMEDKKEKKKKGIIVYFTTSVLRWLMVTCRLLLACRSTTHYEPYGTRDDRIVDVDRTRRPSDPFSAGQNFSIHVFSPYPT